MDFKKSFETLPSAPLSFEIDKLHLAAEKNDVLQVEQLLSEGSDVNITDYFLETPLHFAARKNVDESHFEIIEILLRRGAEVNAQTADGRTPLFDLVMKGNTKMLKLFLKFKADVNLQDRFGETLLYRTVCTNKNEDVLKMLIKLGLDMNHRNNRGQTPLHRLYHGGCDQLKIVKFILKNGGSMNSVDQEGCIPLTHAAQNFIWSKLKLEIIQKNLIFILEHTDFNTDFNPLRKFVDNYEFLCSPKRHENTVWKMVIEHLAKLQTLNIFQHPDFSSNILKMIVNAGDYFKECQEELFKAKNTKFPNSWVTFYNLVVDDRKKLKNYAGNEKLIEDFKKSGYEKEFPIYGALMARNVRKSIKRRELYDKSTVALSSCLPIFNPTHLIVRDVLDCMLSKKELLMFCDEN